MPAQCTHTCMHTDWQTHPMCCTCVLCRVLCVPRALQSASASCPPLDSLKSLLSQWRRKVFSLLVQDKLRQMQLERELQQAAKKVETHQSLQPFQAVYGEALKPSLFFLHIIYLVSLQNLPSCSSSPLPPLPLSHSKESEGQDREAQLQRETELLSHALTDRSAELQIQTNTAKVSGRRETVVYTILSAAPPP